MTAGWKLAVPASAAVMVLPLSLLVVVTAAATSSPGPGYACAAAPSVSADSPGWQAEGSWTVEQVTNAAVIVQVGAERGMPLFGWTIAVATAMQESSLHNLTGGPDDSVGLFQQRPSQGWGTVEQLLDPRYAATKFYEALAAVDGWQNLTLTEAAQRVQRSAYPDAYARWTGEAQHLVELVRDRLGITCTAGGTGPWRLPLPEGSYDFGSPYGPRGGRLHRGVDLMAAYGTPILAAAAGTVSYAGCNSAYCDRPGSPSLGGCGLMVEVQHADGIGTTYCHASVLMVTAGQQVDAGDQLGQVGSTGNSSGNHLHFQVHRPAPPINNSTTVDPVPFMAGVGVRL